MRSLVLRTSALVSAALCIAASGCTTGDAPTAARPNTPDQSLLSSLLSISLLQRLLPLGQSYSASAVIGPAGGTISIPQAGFSIKFPAGAVAAPVTVKATALAGSNVAYEFEPHGIVFAQKPVITQDLGLTGVVNNLLTASSLQGAYFASEGQLGDGSATVNELIPATVSLLGLRMSFPIAHFSGYAVGSKKQGGYITSSNDRSGAPGPRM